MRTIQRKAIQRSHFLSWGLLTFLLSYSLSLCVLSPQAHAALILQAAQNQHTTRHCSAPASVRDARDSRSPGQEDTRLPVCCAVVSLQKATKATSLLDDFFPAVVVISFLCETLRAVWDASSHYPAHSDYSPYSPPLYLFHAVLLI